MAQHKWHKEIKAWADGAEIEWWNNVHKRWETEKEPMWSCINKYRIKPQQASKVIGGSDECICGKEASEHYGPELICPHVNKGPFQVSKFRANEFQPIEPDIDVKDYQKVLKELGEMLKYKVEKAFAKVLDDEISGGKKPQYLYVYESVKGVHVFTTANIFIPSDMYHKYIGKIKLEDTDA